MENNLDIYRFEYFSQSYAPLGRVEQEKLKQKVMSQLSQQLTEVDELVFAKELIDQYFSYLRLSPNPQIIVSNSLKFDLLLSQIARLFNRQNLFFHLAVDPKKVIPSNDDKTYNLLPEQFEILGDLPYISCLILGPDFIVNRKDLAGLLDALNRDGHFFSFAGNELTVKRLGQTKGILGSSEQAQALNDDFKNQLTRIKNLDLQARLEAILALEADYFRYSDYLDLTGRDLIEEINQVKNAVLSDLTQGGSFYA